MIPLLIATVAIASAATVVVETAVPVEVRIDGLPAVKTFGASKVSLPDIEPGPHEFTIWRDDEPWTVKQDVPATGVMRLMIGAESIETANAGTPATDGAPPTVEVRASQGQRFAIVVDGQRTAVIGSDQPLLLDSLEPGSHTFELRTPDLLVVWVRGSLDLQPGDALILTAAEGRMIDVFGRTDAWRPAQAGQERQGAGGDGNPSTKAAGNGR